MAQLSYVHGASSTPLIGETIGVHFDKIVERHGERDAVISRHQQLRWSYRELKERIDAFAAGLLALGLRRGQRIGIWSPNNAEWVVTQFATAKAGLILVNINPAYRLSELEYVLAKAGCAALVTAARSKTSDYLAMLAGLVPELATATRAICRRHAYPICASSLRSTARRRPARCGPTRSTSSAARQNTTGSPSSPKSCSSTIRSTSNPVHQRHDRVSQGCYADPPQYSQ
jgi:fatty-acyl-CoA synthase